MNRNILAKPALTLLLALALAAAWIAAQTPFSTPSARAQTPQEQERAQQIRVNEIINTPDEGAVLPMQYSDTVGKGSGKMIHASDERILSREIDTCRRNDFIYKSHHYSSQNRAWRFLNCRIANVIRFNAIILVGLTVVAVGYSAINMIYQGPENSSTARFNLIVVFVSLGLGILAYAIASVFHVAIEPFNFR